MSGGSDAGVTPQQAAAEYLRRQRARRSLIEYSQAIDIPGAPIGNDADTELFKPVELRVALHHRVMMAAIQRANEVPASRTMLLAPPGSAKSSYASVVDPTWIMGKDPGHRLILTSYASNIAFKQSRKARAICKQPRYSNIWRERPTLLEDQRAVDEWSLTNGSELMAAGILAGITGNRANGAVIDDPVANREAADSPTLRGKIYDEYVDTVQTRLLPGGYVILIMTRWHELDLAGEILPEDYDGESGFIKCRDGHVWHVVCIPAEAEREDDALGRKPGEFLWPEWFPKTHWSTWRDNPRNVRTWSALFQQRPAPVSGIQFNRDMFKWYDPDKAHGDEGGLPLHLRFYGASDFATLADRGDWTEHGVGGLAASDDFYFTDWWSGQKQTDVGIDRFLDKVALWKPTRWFNEGGVIDKAISPAIYRRMGERRTYVTLTMLSSIMDKGMKLQSFHARASAGKIWFPLRRQWALDVVDQLVRFPAGKHDDKADVCGLLGRGIDQMYAPSLPSEETRDILVPFSERWLEWNDRHAKPKVRYF